MRLIICGDWHGTLEINKIPDKEILNTADYIIQLGDFGLIWNNPQIDAEKYWLNYLNELKPKVLFIAGNHENFDLLKKYPVIDFLSGKAAQISENIFWLQNGNIFKFGKLKAWAFGGGLSIDKQNRIIGKSWWPDEIPDYSEMEFGLSELEKVNNKVDIVFTHTVPKIIINFLGINYLKDPVSEYLENVYNRIEFKHWYAGHLHLDKKLEFFNFTLLYDDIVVLEVEDDKKNNRILLQS